ncbi:MAG: UPF0175 family protein [Chloroflexia bacterium]|nr:UPF0175 family protein [Chloroflexia bacterium]
MIQGLSFDRAILSGLAREALLVRLYDIGEVSSGKAAALLGISRQAFLELLNQYGVSVVNAPTDLEADLRNAHVAATDYLQYKSID